MKNEENKKRFIPELKQRGFLERDFVIMKKELKEKTQRVKKSLIKLNEQLIKEAGLAIEHTTFIFDTVVDMRNNDSKLILNGVELNFKEK